MTLRELVRTLQLDVATEPACWETVIEQACVSDLLSNVIATCPGNCLWITVQCHMNVVGVASLLDVQAVIIAGGAKPDPHVISKARDVGVTILTSQDSAFNICGRLFALGIQGTSRGLNLRQTV